MKVYLECTSKYLKTNLASLKFTASLFYQLTCTVVLEVLPLHENTGNWNILFTDKQNCRGVGR